MPCRRSGARDARRWRGWSSGRTILALVMCYELIEMIVEKNNMHDFDSSMFFRWMFKSAFAILIVTNTWNIVMGVFDATQAVVNQSAGVIIGETSIDFDTPPRSGKPP